MPPRKKKTDDAGVKDAVLAAALNNAVFDGFTDKALGRAGEEAGADKETLTRLFPNGPLSLVEAFSESADLAMEAALAALDIRTMKVRMRISTAVMARIEVLKANKEAARRAAAFLTLPPHAALGTKLVYRTVDRMWRAAGDTSTDFNFYTKRAILAGVYSSTLVRWFTDQSTDESETTAFLAARIENVMQFEKLKARVKEGMDRLPPIADVLSAFTRR